MRLARRSPGWINAFPDHMLRETLLRVLHREISSVRLEVMAYPDDDALWRVVPGISNSGGTLALHLAGNLRHFVGTVFGGTGFVRDREWEFAARNLSRADVAAHLTDTLSHLVTTLEELDPARLDAMYPAPVGPDLQVPADALMVHLAVHTGYHLGQIDYHRRIVTGDPTTVATLPMAKLIGAMPTNDV